MVISRFFVILFSMAYLAQAEENNNQAHLALLNKGFQKFEIKHDTIVNGVDVFIVCKSHGSAFRRCSMEIFSFSEGKLNSHLATTFNASTIKIKEKDGVLDVASGISNKLLIRINLKYIILSNRVLVDDTTK